MIRKPVIARVATAIGFFAVAAVTSLSLPAQAAGEALYELPLVASSSVDRAEVRRLAIAARAAGQVVHGEIGFVPELGRSLVSRAQVRAETLEAIRLGAIVHGEGTWQPDAMQLAQIRLAGQRAVAADTMRMAAR